MKKYLLIIIMMLSIILTGCDSSSDNQNKMENDSKNANSNSVICTLTTEEENVKMNQTVTLKFDSTFLDLAKIQIDAVLADNYLKYTKEFVETLKNQFANYDQYGIKVDINETSKGANVTYTMDKDSFSDLYNAQIDKNEIMKMFEDLGYTCN